MEPESLADWLESEHTQVLRAKAEALLVSARDDLLGVAMSSTDPRAVAAAATVRRYETIVRMMRKGELDG